MMLSSFLHLLLDSMRPRQILILKIIALEHQIHVLKRNQNRPRLKDRDRLLWLFLRRALPDWRGALYLVQPETVIRWHRNGFRWFWRRKSRLGRRGRPRLALSTRALVLKIANENPTWGAPRI